ncbi:MAG: hypothetical protein QF437_04450 [Planctomycetota bacterium]|jgi:hypothetical protein|nr:hypothetical protein [Planctomycetota bacterium]
MQGQATLPDYVHRLKETIPAWMERLEHPDGIGRYRFALEAFMPYDTLSSAMAHCVMNIVQPEHPYLCDSEKALAWADYLLSYQIEDGHIADVAHEDCTLSGEDGEPPSEQARFDNRRGQTRNILYIACQLGRLPRHRQTHDDGFTNPNELVAWLDGLHWHNPWGAGSWASAVLSFQFFNKLLGDEDAAAMIETGRQWLTERQDPKTGTWSDGSDIAPHILVNGIFKVWMGIPFHGVPVQYCEKVIDLCIETLLHDPAVCERFDACSVFDVATVLDVCLRHVEHRKDEIAELAAGYLPELECMVQPDGGMSYLPEGPVHRLSPKIRQSELGGTALHCQALALLANLCGLRDELGWVPCTEWHVGYPSSPIRSV